MSNNPRSYEKSKSEKCNQGEQRKQMAQKLMEASEDKINRNIKDSVFCDLFGKPEYLFSSTEHCTPKMRKPPKMI